MKATTGLYAALLPMAIMIPLRAGQAASTAPQSSGELEEVIVTAEKVEKDLQKTSIAIDVYSGEQLAQEGRSRMDEVLRGVPGVEMQPDGVSMAFTIRGFSAGGIAPSPNGVGVVIDGVTQTTPTANQLMRSNMLDTEQVEVARGTQQTNIGANSLAGSFSVVSRKPQFDYEAKGKVELGSYRLRNMEGVLNVPISDTQAVRVAYSSNQRDGYISSGAGEASGRNVRVRHRWKPSDSLDITTTYLKQELGGNPTATNTLLATGHWVSFAGQQSVVGFNGITYPTNPTTAPIFQNAATYTFAAGSRLGPGAVPLPAAAATNYSQLCTPQGALFSTTSTTTPFITSMGCPATYIAMRDNVAWYDRRNPWDDGFPFKGYPNNAHRDTYLTTYSTEIVWKTDIGTWTFVPSYQSGKMYAIGIPNGTGAGNTPWVVNDEINPNRQLEIRLTSNPDSKIAWLAGIFGTYNMQPEQYNYNVVFPTTAPATLVRPSVGNNAATGAPLEYVLPVSAGGPVTLGTNQVRATGTSSCYVFNASYCYTQGGRNTKSNTGSISLYGNMSVPFFDNRLRSLLGLRLTSNYRKTLGRAGGTILTDANQNPANDGLVYFTGTIPADVSSLNCGTVTGGTPNGGSPCLVNYVVTPRPYTVNNWGWNGDVSYFNGSTWTYAKAKRFDVQYRAGLEYDILPSMMLYGAYATARQPTNFDTTTLILPEPLELGQTTLGFKSRWLNNRLQVNVEGFNAEYHNRAASAVYGSLFTLTPGANTFSCPTPAPGVVATAVVGATGTAADSCFNRPLTSSNTADMYSRGVDMDVSWAITPVDRFNVAAEFLIAKSTAIQGVARMTAADVLAAAAANSTSVSPTRNTTTAAQQAAAAQVIADQFNADLDAAPGGTLQESPRWSGNASYQHEFMFSNGSRLTPRLDMRFRTAYWSRNPGGQIRQARVALETGNFEPSVQKAYTMWNFYLNWESADGKWSVSPYVNNITNKAVLLNTSGTTGTGQTVQANNLQLTGGFVTLDAPRTMGVSLSASF